MSTNEHHDPHAKFRKAKPAARSRKRTDDGKLVLFWLDFHRPEDGSFLGACVVPSERENFIGAVQAAHYFKCNPGGQCTWIEVKNLERAPRSYLVRLLDADEVGALMAILRGKVN